MTLYLDLLVFPFSGLSVGMVTTKPAGRLLSPLVCRSLMPHSGRIPFNLLVLRFALVFNWPIFLHFYRILSALEHVKAGFVLFHSPGTGGGPLNAVFPCPYLPLSAQAFFALLILDRPLVSYAMLKYGVIFRHGHDAEHHRDQQRGGGLPPQRLRGALCPR